MFQTQNRCGGGLRLLRTGDVRGMRRFTLGIAHGLLHGLLNRARPPRRGHANDSSEKCAEPEGERVLLLSLRRVVGRSRHRGVVHVALHVPHSLHQRVRRGFVCVGDLVHARLAQTGLSLGRTPLT
jgi:hypothetical protein